MKTKTLKVTAEIKKIFDNSGKTKAAASITIEGVFVVRGVRLVDGKNGLFISMPSHKTVDGEYIDICFPISNETRLLILDTVIAAYEKALSEQDEAGEDAGDGKADADAESGK